MELTKGILTSELGIYLIDTKTLVISDIHFGYEGMLEKQGVLIPRFQLKDILLSLERIFQTVPVKRVVISGDLKHEFGKILKQEWNDIAKFFEFLKNKNIPEIIIVKGNHDVILGPLVKNIQLIKEYKIGNILVIHGDSKPKTQHTKTIIMGHEHPAITLHEAGRSEKFKCFLKGKYQRKNLIVLPSFNQLTQGNNILKEKHLSPLLKNLKNFEVFIYDAKEKDVLKFGKVKDLITQ